LKKKSVIAIFKAWNDEFFPDSDKQAVVAGNGKSRKEMLDQADADLLDDDEETDGEADDAPMEYEEDRPETGANNRRTHPTDHSSDLDLMV